MFAIFFKRTARKLFVKPGEASLHNIESYLHNCAAAMFCVSLQASLKGNAHFSISGKNSELQGNSDLTLISRSMGRKLMSCEQKNLRPRRNDVTAFCTSSLSRCLLAQSGQNVENLLSRHRLNAISTVLSFRKKKTATSN